jgi:YaiO family outer membrane protein
MRLRGAVPVFVLVSCVAGPAVAQTEEVISSARAAAAEGRRAEALSMLESHLSVTPLDVDARLVYGIVLSWESRYDDARRELQKVLGEAPEYLDARVALMNVEWWSGRIEHARAAARSILATEPGNTQARAVWERVEAAARPWEIGLAYGVDSFSDDRLTWHEAALSVIRRTPVGPVIARATRAERFGSEGHFFEAEFYPRLRTGTYAYVAVGASNRSSFYPSFRISGDLYHALGRGVELSLGYRRLDFEAATDIYVATVSRYFGNWMITGKVFHVPGVRATDSISYHGGVRRYVRGDGTSFIGVTYSHGFAREEIRNLADLTTVDSDTIRADGIQMIGRRLRLSFGVGTSRQERQEDRPLWQTTVSSGLTVLF